MKRIALLFGIFFCLKASAQFDALKAHPAVTPKMEKIYSIDTAVFALLNKYSHKEISKQTWMTKNSLLMKKFDALHCRALTGSEKELWRIHKQAMADYFLNHG